jgi:hypothetical protein
MYRQEAIMFMGESVPKVSMSIEKVDNGYTVKLVTYPKPEPPGPAPFLASDEADPEEQLDAVIDALSCFLRAVNDKATGEEWKGEEDREKIRKGIKMMFPSMSRTAGVVGFAAMPRSENRVFESKDALLKYLSENL